MPDIVVVGAGIMGLAAAYELVSVGCSVTVFDTYARAAMASGWTLGGVRQSGRDAAELPLARAAVALWSDLGERLDASIGYRQDGNLRVARTVEEMEIIRRLVDSQRASGLDLRLLDTGQVRDIAPAISDAVLGASFCPTDGYADPLATCQAYLSAARRQGADYRPGTTVERIECRDGRVQGVWANGTFVPASHVIVAAGLQGNALLAPLNLAVPINPHMVSVLRGMPGRQILSQVIGVANADCAGRQEPDGRFRVTSGVLPWHGVLSGGTRPVVPTPASSFGRIVERFTTVVPSFADALIEECWSGLIDLTPDALPVIDAPPEIDGLVIAMGFSGHGFCLGPVVGQVLRDLVIGNGRQWTLDPFRHGRFEGTTGDAGASLTLHG
ncbi:FAD-binding oxidoreductase [Gluconacetobacter azotocaptans]|uniref:NAD(P)/FAD-dependent oxidoreductase n=1 Tax=Gluconacetobacter azotocaptans TaxID=142834 RepID=UPI00195B7418|nr:FAD-binding oxidoreductase [Gluconacetobacter azotocaptans]MBM9400754.1 FAD-binding oxidoreductase [Gluconacetobacter azotocaptans]